MTKLIPLILLSLFFSFCFSDEDSLSIPGELDMKDAACSLATDGDVVNTTVCQSKTATMANGDCCVVSATTGTYAGKAMCGAVLNTEANITDVITRVTASLKFTPTISCPENIYETSLKDCSCKTTSKDESEDDCKEKKAKTDGASCCVLKKKDATTFNCAAVENTDESKTAYLAVVSKSNKGEKYELDCSASYVKTAIVVISLIVLLF